MIVLQCCCVNTQGKAPNPQGTNVQTHPIELFGNKNCCYKKCQHVAKSNQLSNNKHYHYYYGIELSLDTGMMDPIPTRMSSLFLTSQQIVL